MSAKTIRLGWDSGTHAARFDGNQLLVFSFKRVSKEADGEIEGRSEHSVPFFKKKIGFDYFPKRARPALNTYCDSVRKTGMVLVLLNPYMREHLRQMRGSKREVGEHYVPREGNHT